MSERGGATGAARSSGLRRARHAAVALILAAPLLGLPWVGSRVADETGQAAAREAVALAASLRRPPTGASFTGDAPGEVLGGVTARARATRPGSIDEPAERARPRKPPPRALHVPAAAVARAVRAGVRPSGTPVSAEGKRPAGLVLAGVGGLGGLRDGDVLTAAAGAPATSPEAVIGAVAAAIAGGATTISGVVWRGDHRIALSVEVPSRQPRPAKPAKPAKRARH